MAGSGGRSAHPLSEKLVGEPGRFGFFQAVRLLERIAGSRGSVGEDTHIRDEAVRFHAAASTSFPASEVSAIRPPDEQGPGPAHQSPYQMVVTFMGLIGPKGVLPSYFTRLVQRRNRAKDQTLREFLDLFNHRAISLFYRAWVKYRFPIAYEREKRREIAADDQFTGCLYGLVGLGTAGQRSQRMATDERSFLYYAGLFAHFPRSAVTLQGMLADHLGISVRVRQFTGQWLTLESPDRTRLPGRSVRDEVCHNQLGWDSILGERAWDVASKFRIRLEGLSLDQFWRFLPPPVGDSLGPLGQLTRIYAGPDLDFDIQLVLRRDEWAWSSWAAKASRCRCSAGTSGSDPSRSTPRPMMPSSRARSMRDGPGNRRPPVASPGGPARRAGRSFPRRGCNGRLFDARRKCSRTHHQGWRDRGNPQELDPDQLLV